MMSNPADELAMYLCKKAEGGDVEAAKEVLVRFISIVGESLHSDGQSKYQSINGAPLGSNIEGTYLAYLAKCFQAALNSSVKGEKIGQHLAEALHLVPPPGKKNRPRSSAKADRDKIISLEVYKEVERIKKDRKAHPNRASIMSREQNTPLKAAIKNVALARNLSEAVIKTAYEKYWQKWMGEIKNLHKLPP